MTSAEINDPRGPIDLLIAGIQAVGIGFWLLVFTVMFLAFVYRQIRAKDQASIEFDEHEEAISGR